MPHRANGQRRPFRRAFPVLALSVGLWALCSCGTKENREDRPDMSQIRGDPIEAPIGPGVEEENARASRSVTQPEVDAKRQGWDEPAPGEPVMVTFDELAAFDYVLPPAMDGDADPEPGRGAIEEHGRIPDSIQALDGRLVGLRGFMLPTRLEGGLTTEFLLMRDQSMCCFGVMPRINEWVGVTMIGRGVRPMMDQPVTVFGRLHVGESYEGGVMVGIYRMDGEDLAGPLDL
jgi:hypothetical protein